MIERPASLAADLRRASNIAQIILIITSTSNYIEREDRGRKKYGEEAQETVAKPIGKNSSSAKLNARKVFAHAAAAGVEGLPELPAPRRRSRTGESRRARRRRGPPRRSTRRDHSFDSRMTV